MHQTARKTTSRDIVFGVGITGVIFLVAGYVPVLGMLWLFMLPLSAFYYRAKLGRSKGLVVVTTVSFVAAVAWGGLTPDVGLGMGLMLLGFMLGEFSEKGLPVELTVLYSTVGVLACGLAVLLFYGNVSGTGVKDLLAAYVAENLEMSLRFYREAGMAADRLAELAASLDALKQLLVAIFPALAATLSIVAAWITLLAARPIMTARGFAPCYPESLNRWIAPDPLVWGVVAGGVAMLLFEGPVETAALNLLIVLGAVYFLQGIAVVSFFFEKKGAPRPLRIMVYGMMALWQMLIPVVSVLGLFDTWADFRKLRTESGDGRNDEQEIS